MLTFAAEAGEAITLNAPSIVRSNNTTVTITADQTDKLLSPTATIYYEYGAESGSFTGSKVLTVAADATITAYAVATGYTTSATAERAVALFPTNVEAIENTEAKTKDWSANTWGDTEVVSERNYAPLLLDDVQWGTNIYLQNDAAWNFRNSGNWYNNGNVSASWILMKSMKAGDIIVANIDYAASDMVNATYSEKLSYSNRHAYEVTADGDVELAFKNPSAKDMDYLYGVYAYRTVTAVSTTLLNTYGTIASAYALDCANLPTGLTAYQVTSIAADKVTLTQVTEAVAAGTGLILKGTGGETYNIPVVASGTDISATNKLNAAVTATDVDANAAYVLYKDEFRKVTNASSVPAGKAFLLATDVPAEARSLTFDFGDATGISAIAKSQEPNANGYYNLAGQRVAQPQKGLYIQDGKKVIIK